MHIPVSLAGLLAPSDAVGRTVWLLGASPIFGLAAGGRPGGGRKAVGADLAELTDIVSSRAAALARASRLFASSIISSGHWPST